MKLLELNIENYGVYSARHFTFDGRLQLICGPNEAGKSTLLQLIRELLFGFPHQSPYAFDSHAGEVAATAEIELGDGRRARFRRRKGRKDTVSGEIDGGNEVVDESRLAELLDNAGGELYQHVFGFSLKELASGEQSLESANLSEALYGGGIGGLANFQQVQQELRREHLDLYSPRGRKPTVNRLLAQIREQSKLLRETAVKPRQYDDQQSLLEDREAEVERLRDELEQLRTRAHRLERLERAFDSWSRCTAAREELATLTECDHVPPDGAAELRRLKEKLEDVEESIRTLQTQLEEQSGDVDPELLQNAPQLIEAEGPVRTLHQDVGRMRSFLHDVPLRRQECETLTEEVRARIRELNPEWTLNHLDEFSSSLAQRDTVQQLAEELRDLQQQKELLSSKRGEAERRLTLTRKRLSELEEPHSLAALEDLLHRSQIYQSQRSSLSELKKSIASLDADVAELARQLAGVEEVADADPPDAETTDAETTDAETATPETPALPPTAAVREFGSRFEEVAERLRSSSQRFDEASRELAELESTLREAAARRTVVTRDELLERRGERDDAWRRIRGRYVDGAPDAGESVPTAGEFEQVVRDVDRLSDDRLANAEEVARREQLAAGIDRQRQRVRAAEQALQSARADRAALDEEWRALWRPAGVRPLSPAAMLDWLKLHGEYAAASRRRRELEADAAACTEAVQKFERELARALPTPLESPEASLAEARRRLDSLREAINEHRRLEDERPQLETEMRGFDQELSQFTMQSAEWQSRWDAFLRESRFPSGWPVGTAQRILTELAELRQKAGEATSLEKRAADMQAEFSEYESQVGELCNRLARDLVGHPAPDAVLELFRRIEAAKHAAQQQSDQSHEAAATQRTLALRRQYRDELQQQVKGLLARAGVETEEEFVAAAADAARREQLLQQIREHEQQVRAIRGNDDERAFQAELQQTDVDRLRQERDELDRRIAERDDDYRTAVERRGIAAKQVDELDGGTRTLAISAELESSRSELGTAVDRWGALVLAEELMQRAIRRFEQEHQPQMLEEVSRLLRQMTGGRYVRIQRRLDDRGTLLVEDAAGNTKTPSQLSTGAREQLYLAIRLAFVLHYCRQSEPLPLVMDDVLVNFDEQRARQTLEVLTEISETAQILFLTCHRHTAELFARIFPAGRPIELAPATIASPSQETIAPQSTPTPAAESSTAESSTAESSTAEAPRSSRKKPKPPRGEPHPELFPK